VGTSNPFGGPGGGTPLIPSWLGGGGGPDGANPPPPGVPPAPSGPPSAPDNGGSPSQPSGTPGGIPSGSPAPSGAPSPGGPTPGGPVPGGPGAPPRLPMPAPGAPRRFAAARTNLSRFASSGGNDRASLGRAVSGYVSTASGGARTAAMRMGASRGAGSRLMSFMADAAVRGAREALRALNLDALAGRPIEEIFLGLTDYICPEGGTIDEGIARDAFIETIAQLAARGVADLDGMTPDQMRTVFELYATNAIEARLCNDIGAKTIMLPADAREARRVQDQLRDFIRGGVSDALARASALPDPLTPNRALAFVAGVYEQAFEILQTMGDAEAA
jgi:hypothetical protein